MSVTEILEELEAMPRSDKFRVLQRLVADIAREEAATPLRADAVYPVWAPHDAFEAADTLLQALEAEPSVEHG